MDNIFGLAKECRLRPILLPLCLRAAFGDFRRHREEAVSGSYVR